MAQNQTVSFLLKRFAEIGIHPDTRKGQNFLIDVNLQKLLVRTADLSPRDVVLEVGTGTGALTELMAQEAAAVVTVEVDQHLYQLASEILIDADNVTMLHHDALRNKNRLDPRMLEAVREHLEAEPGRRFKLVANLPYNIATPLLSNLLESDPLPVTMTATIQKELADRIVARPSTKDYGSLSIWMQSQCQVEIVRVLAPSVFWPRPKVTSAIVQVTIDNERRARIGDLRYFHQLIRAMFIHRRKFLRANVLGAMKGHLSKAEVDDLLAKMQFSPDTRAEQIDVETMLAFCELVRENVPDWKL